MIFSLLNVRKKTAATIAGIAIGALCLWGVSMWQDISMQELFNILLSLLVLLIAVIGTALLLITILKLTMKLMKRVTGRIRGADKHQANEVDQEQSDSGHR